MAELLVPVPGHLGELVPGCVHPGYAGHSLEVRSRKGGDSLARYVEGPGEIPQVFAGYAGALAYAGQFC